MAKFQQDQAWVYDQMAADPSGGDHDWAGFAEDARMRARAYQGYAAQDEQRQTDYEKENPQ